MKNNIVTSIEQQVKSDDRYSVFIDGEFAFGISDFDLYTLKIRVGDVIDDKRLAEIENVISVDKCKNYAVGIVSRKMYTKKEITEKMLGKGFTNTAVSEVVAILEEYGYIDDRVYAELYVREYMKKYGARKLSYNLKLKGINEDLIKEYCADLDNCNDLLKLIKSKIRGDIDDRKEYDRIVRQFLSKGFEYDDIKHCLDTIKEGCDNIDE